MALPPGKDHADVKGMFFSFKAGSGLKILFHKSGSWQTGKTTTPDVFFISCLLKDTGIDKKGSIYCERKHASSNRKGKFIVVFINEIKNYNH